MEPVFSWTFPNSGYNVIVRLVKMSSSVKASYLRATCNRFTNFQISTQGELTTNVPLCLPLLSSGVLNHRRLFQKQIVGRAGKELSWSSYYVHDGIKYVPCVNFNLVVENNEYGRGTRIFLIHQAGQAGDAHNHRAVAARYGIPGTWYMHSSEWPYPGPPRLPTNKQPCITATAAT